MPTPPRVPPWPLRASAPPESERLRQLRVKAETTPNGPPGAIWRGVCFTLLRRLEDSRDPKIRRLADIAVAEILPLVTHDTTDQAAFYWDTLDEMRRLNISRVRPEATDVGYLYLRCRQVRQALEENPVRGRAAAVVQAGLRELWHRISGKEGPPIELAAKLSRRRGRKETALSARREEDALRARLGLEERGPKERVPLESVLHFVAEAETARGAAITSRTLRSRLALWKLEPMDDAAMKLPTRDERLRARAAGDVEPRPRPRRRRPR